MLRFWGRMFSESIVKVEDYRNLPKVITINILDFNYIELDKFHTKFHLWEDESKDYMLTDLIEIHFVEVPKFNELEKKDLKQDRLQRWLTFFNNDISEEKLKELMEMDADIKRAEKRLEYLSSDKNTIEIYKAREKSLHERANMINSAKDEGKIEVVKNALREGLSAEMISKITGKTFEEIEKIKKMIN